MRRKTALLSLVILLGLNLDAAARITLKPVGTFATGIFGEGAAEIVAHDPKKQRLFIVNGASATIDVIDVSDPTKPSLLFAIDITPYGGSANSVDVHKDVVAAAVENESKTEPGKVVFFDTDGNFLKSVVVGALPDMITFTPNGKRVLVANEGEPSDDYSVDPEGSVSIVDLSRGVSRVTQSDVTTADFKAFSPASLDPSVRIFGPNATVAEDLEPEFITVSDNSKKAWVVLQENNAVAVLDIQKGFFTKIKGLGFKDHSLDLNGLDAGDEDGAINIAKWPVMGMYQPDGVSHFRFRGKTFLITANEGDGRDYDGFSEEARVKDLSLDPIAFPNAPILQQEGNLGRLTVTSANGDADGDGDFDELFAFGARSFSIWTKSGELVFDSGDDFEQITASRLPSDFNSENDENDSFDKRSDNKGPEPEGVVIGKVSGRTYAFIGLERIGGIMVYDVTDPFSPSFVEYVNNRDFSGDPGMGTAGDLGPEGLIFIRASKSPNGKPLLVVANEVSGTTTIYEIDKIN